MPKVFKSMNDIVATEQKIFKATKNAIGSGDIIVDKKSKDNEMFLGVMNVKNGRLQSDKNKLVKMGGFANEDELKKYRKKYPEAFRATKGIKISGASVGPFAQNDVEHGKYLSNVALSNVAKRFKNTDTNEINNIINILNSGKWQNAETMEKYKKKIGIYADDYIALNMAGYFDYIPEKDRKNNIDSLKVLKEAVNNQSKVFADYDDAKSYEKAVNDFKNYNLMKNTDPKIAREEIDAWQKELDKLKDNHEWLNGEWRKNSDGDYTVPYSATNIPDFLGKTITEIETMVSQKRELLRLVEKETLITDLTNTAQSAIDFEAKSNFEPKLKYNKSGLNASDVDDLILEYIYADDKLQGQITMARRGALALEYGSDYTLTRDMYDWSEYGYDQLSDKEKRIATYYYNTDIDAFWKYLEANESKWKDRGAKELSEKMSDTFGGKTFMSVVGSVDRIGQSTKGMLNYVVGDETYVEPTKTQLTSQYVRQNLDGFDAFLYDAVDTFTYMTPSILMNAAVPGSGFVLMGITAAGGAYNDGINMGMTASQARMYGTLIGVAESGLESLFSGVAGLTGKMTGKSIEKVVAGINSGIIKFVATIGVNAVSEGFEEFAQEVLEPLFENIALGYNKNNWDDVDWDAAVYSGLLGMFMGGVSNVGPMAIKVASDSKNSKTQFGFSKESVYAIVNNGFAMPKNSTAYKQALKVDTKLKSGKHVSGTALYNLANAIESEIETKSAVRLAELGMDKQTINGLSPIVAKAVFGEKLTPQEHTMLIGNEIAVQIVKELSVDRANTVWRDVIKNSRIDNATDNSSVNEGVEVLQSTEEDAFNGVDGSKYINVVDSNDGLNYNKNSIVEGENYGSENSELLERGTISATYSGEDVLWESSTNSAALEDSLEISQGNDGTHDNPIWAGESDWIDRKSKTQRKPTGNKTSDGLAQRVIGKIQGIKLSGKDTIGGIASPQILEKFKNTVCKDENGNLISLYHWTTDNFKVFSRGDIGFHFGTLRSAHERYLQKKENKLDVSKGIYKEVILNIINPIELSDDSLEWTAGWVAIQLLEKGIISEQLYYELAVLPGFNDLSYDNPAVKAVREILSENGYDGIIYKNQSEDIGSYSIIALYPEQVITISENGVLKEDSGISRAISNDEVALLNSEIDKIDADDVINGIRREEKYSFEEQQGTVETRKTPELINLIDRLLNGEYIKIDEINAIPIIKNIKRLSEINEKTYKIDTLERHELREKIIENLLQYGSAVDSNGKVVYNGSVKQEYRADIVIGLPGSGKSSVLVEPLSMFYASRVIDSDIAKKMLPEYNGGIGADAVHKESVNINNIVLQKAMKKGDNIVYQMIGGGKVNSLINKIKMFKESGYSVYLHLVELPNCKAIARSLNRYIEEGRFVLPKIIEQYGDTPTQNFYTIVNAEEHLDERQESGKYGKSNSTDVSARIWRKNERPRISETELGGTAKTDENRILTSDRRGFVFRRVSGIDEESGVLRSTIPATKEESDISGKRRNLRSPHYGVRWLELVDGYSHYSNDVERGEIPKLINISENVREFAEQRDKEVIVNDIYSTNAVTNSLENYPQAKMGMIVEFIESVDERLKALVERVKSGSDKFERFIISNVSSREANDIKKLFGVDAKGCTHNINTNGIKHILKCHGANGQQDNTMSNDNDIARMGWVIKNYDNVEVLFDKGGIVTSDEFIGVTNRRAPQIRYSKKINGTYYIVEAVFENKYNKLWVQSAYLRNKKEVVTQSGIAVNDKSWYIKSSFKDKTKGNDEKILFELTEPDMDNIEVSEEVEFLAGLSGVRLNKIQKHIIDICRKLDDGITIEFVDKFEGNGKYVASDNKLLIKSDLSAVQMYVEVFKHEFMHRLETKQLYNKFYNYCFEKSKAFEQYVRAEAKLTNADIDVDAMARESVLNLYTEYKYNQYKSDKNILKKDRDAFTVENAREEIIADFFSQILFQGDKYRARIIEALQNADGKMLVGIGDEISSEAALMELKQKEPTLFEQVIGWIRDIINSLRRLPHTKSIVEQLDNEINQLESMARKAYQSKDSKRLMRNKYDEIKFSLMNDNTFESNVDNIITMNDIDALLNKKEGNFVRVMYGTPAIVRDNVEDVENLDVIISFYSLYLAIRKNGVLEGHYQNFGSEIIKKLPQYINNPDAIVRTNNGRLNLFAQIETSKGNNGILSVELNTVKDINNHYDKYNLVVTVFSAADNYTRNNIIKNVIKVEYKKENLLQVNPQLYEWLMIVNNKLSINNINEKELVVNSKDSKQLMKKKLKEEKYLVERSIKSSSDSEQELRHIENYSEEVYNEIYTYVGENLHDTPQYLRPSTDQEWHSFCRSFANKTTNISQGDFKIITIFTADNYYLIKSDGYMSGSILSKNNIDEYNEKEQIFDDDTSANIFVAYDEGTGNREGNRYYDGDTFAGGIPDTFDVELDEFIAKHPEWFANRRESYADYKRRLESTSSDEVDFSSGTNSFSLADPDMDDLEYPEGIVNSAYNLRDTENAAQNDNPSKHSLGSPIQQSKYNYNDITVEKYTEKQYNNFGWVRYNDVLNAQEYSILLSRYADYKRNKNKYPTTRFGEAVIHSSECPDVLMYVKGKINSPQITKVVRINSDENWELSFIKEEILSNEYKQESFSFNFIERYYAQGVLIRCKARDYASYREYERGFAERGSGQESNTTIRKEQDGRRSGRKNTRVNRADSISESAFSLSSSIHKLKYHETTYKDDKEIDNNKDILSGKYTLGSPIQQLKYNPDEYAKQLIDNYNSNVDSNKIGKMLKKLIDNESVDQEETLQDVYDENGEYVGELTEMQRLINEIAVTIADEVRTLNDEYAQEVISLVAEDYLYVNRKQRLKIKEIYGMVYDYNDILGVKLRTTDDPLLDEDVESLDDAWEYWADGYPELFNNIISSDDMPARLAEIMEYLYTLREDIDYEGIASDIVDDLCADFDNDDYEGNEEASEVYRKRYAELKRENIDLNPYNREIKVLGDNDIMKGAKDVEYLTAEIIQSNLKKMSKSQYDRFGWLVYNKVITEENLELLLQEYLKNIDIYPVTRFGETVVYSDLLPDVIMYVKGPAINPIITKVVKIENDSVEEIREDIILNERDKDLFSLISAQDIYDGIIIFKPSDEISYWEYLRQEKNKKHAKKDEIKKKARESVINKNKVNEEKEKKEEKIEEIFVDESKQERKYCFVHCTDEEKIAEAEKMEQDGRKPMEIWNELYVLRGIFGDWVRMLGGDRFAIFVNGGAKTATHTFNEKLVKPNGNLQGTLSDFLRWKSLYRAYPQFSEVPVLVIKSAYDKDTVKFLPQQKSIIISKKLFDDYAKNKNPILKQHLIREIQRMIQVEEGKYSGKNHEYWKKLEQDDKLPFWEGLNRKLTADDMMNYFIDNYEAELAADMAMIDKVVERKFNGKMRPVNELVLSIPQIEPDKAITLDDDGNFVTVREKDSITGENIFANFYKHNPYYDATPDENAEEELLDEDILNEHYKFGTYYGEELFDSPNALKPRKNYEWREFCSELYNKTKGMIEGEKRRIEIITSRNHYVVDAVGFMSGKIISKERIDKYKKRAASNKEEGAFFMPENQEFSIEYGESTMAVKAYVATGQSNQEKQEMIKRDEKIKGGNSGFIKNVNDIVSGKTDQFDSLIIGDEFKRKLYSNRLIPVAEKDTAGRIIGKKVQKILNDIVLKNDKGEPLSVYKINKHDNRMYKHELLGVVVGTIDMAVQKYTEENNYKSKHTNVYCEEYYAIIKRPLMLHFEPYEVSIKQIGSYLAEESIISWDEYFELLDMADRVKSPKYFNAVYKKLRQILKERGYDSIIYLNQKYDPGTLSVVTFDKEQLYLVAKNGVLVENNGITDENNKIDLSETDGTDVNIRLMNHFMEDEVYMYRKSRKTADERITAGSSDWFENENHSAEDAYKKIVNNIKGKTQLEYNKYASLLNRELNQNGVNKMQGTVFKTSDGDFVSFYIWSKKEITPYDIVRNGIEIKSFNGAFGDFVNAKKKSSFSYNGIFYEYNINSVNPLIVYSEGWNTADMLNYLYENGKITQKFYDEIMTHSHLYNPKYTNHAAKKVRAKIEMLGYDSIVFVKESGETTLLLFDEKQMLPITENGILCNNNGITLKDADSLNNATDVEYVVIDRKDRSARDIKKMQSTILSMNNNTEKMLWLTEYLACTNDPKLDSAEEFNIGHSGILENKVNNIWEAKLLLKILAERATNKFVEAIDVARRKVFGQIRRDFNETIFKDNNQRLLSFFVWNKYGEYRYEHSAFPYTLGTLSFARDNNLFDRRKHPHLTKGVYEEYYINAKNVYLMTTKPNDISVKTIADDMYGNGVLSDIEYKKIIFRKGVEWSDRDNYAAEYFREVMKQKGLDAVVYLNDEHGKGTLAIIVFDESKLYLVSKNGKAVSNIVEKNNNYIVDTEILNGIINDDSGRRKLTGAERAEIKQKTGWSDEILDYISSLEEAYVYINAKLIEVEINGRKCLIRNDIDPDQVNENGLTNKEIMAKGKAPYATNGEKIELHHIGQQENGPLAELTESEHRKNGNSTILHNKKKGSLINRAKFNAYRRSHWKSRMK